MSLRELLKRMAEGTRQVMEWDKPPKEYKYSSIYDYVSKEGQTFESAPLTAREWALVRLACRYTEMKQCFANCQRVVVNETALFKYIEGYVAGDIGIPIHHAWLSLNGKVVDPTLRFHTTRPFRRKTFPNRVMGLIPNTWEYYGVAIPYDQMKECIERNEMWHTVIDDWKNGFPLLKGEGA